MRKALIFDCDGVLADTERDGHLPAFNDTFRAAGLPLQWTSEEYHKLLEIGGGKERLATIFDTGLVTQSKLPIDPSERMEFIAALHRDKTERYSKMIRSGGIPGRPGVRRLAKEADASGWLLAVASTSAEKSVRAVLEHVVGPDLEEKFRIFAGDIVPKKKPAPDIYRLALKELGVAPENAVVIEDSGVGLRASLAAGLTTIVTTSSYTLLDDFAGAALVVSSLGEAPDTSTVVRQNPNSLKVDNIVTLSNLESLIDRRLRHHASREK